MVEVVDREPAGAAAAAAVLLIFTATAGWAWMVLGEDLLLRTLTKKGMAL